MTAGVLDTPAATATPSTHSSSAHSDSYEAANSNIQTHVTAAHAPSGVTVGADWAVNVMNKPTLGTAAAQDVGAFDAAGSASAVQNSLSSHIGLTSTAHGGIPAAQVQTDWNAGEGMGVLLNKPSIPSQYTDELAQDAVGGMLTGGSLAYNDSTPLLSLVNDADTPGNNKTYGTDAVGTKGYRDFPSAGAHDLGGASHNADTLANLNAKVSDADVVALAGQIGGTAASPTVLGLRETGGPTLLTMAAVTDGQYLKRNGSTIDGGSPGGSAADPLLRTRSIGTLTINTGEIGVVLAGGVTLTTTQRITVAGTGRMRVM